MGFPIRKFPDQSLFAAPRDLSQRTTSFIASQRQGIHRTPLRHLIALIANARGQKTEDGKQRTEDGQIRSPFSDVRSPTSDQRWTFEKTNFASNASGNLSGQARLTTGLERLRAIERNDKPRGCAFLAPVARPNAFPLHNVR